MTREERNIARMLTAAVDAGVISWPKLVHAAYVADKSGIGLVAVLDADGRQALLAILETAPEYFPAGVSQSDHFNAWRWVLVYVYNRLMCHPKEC